MSAAKSGERAGIFLCPIWAPHGIRAGFLASTAPSTIGRAIRRQPVRNPPAEPEAVSQAGSRQPNWKRLSKPETAEHEGEQSDLRAAARSRVVCARAAPDRVFLSLTPSHFFPAVGNGGAPGS